MVISDALSLIPWTRWLTWLLQVMPIFFLVGGYVNGLGWQSAQQRQEGYASWLTGRLHRLINPVLPVLAVWTLFGLGAVLFDADRALLKIASQFALLPAWFLVVYILVVLLVPLAHRAWQRYGFASFWALAAPRCSWTCSPSAWAGAYLAGSTTCSSGLQSINWALPGRPVAWPRRAAVCSGPPAG